MDLTDMSDKVDRSVSTWAPTTLRILAGLLWLSNVSWKVPPDFGRVGDGCSGLCGYVNAGAEHSVLPGSTWLFGSVVSPNLAAFGWLTLFVEAGLAAALLSGRFVRIAAVIGILQSAGIGLAVANADGEWYWSYGLMIALHLAVLALAPSVRATSARMAGACAAAYGLVLVLAHTAGGITGDGSFTLFEQKNDFPGDFGRNIFPGSIALGLLFIVVGLAVWALAGRPATDRRIAGYILVAVSALLLVTYGTDGLILHLRSRATTAAVLAAVGLSLSGTKGRDADRSTSRDRSSPAMAQN